MGDVTLLPPAGAAGLYSFIGVEGGGDPKVNMGVGGPKVNMVLNFTTRLIRDGENGGKGYGGRGRGREIIYLSLHCHHQNDFCIKMGSGESHFNVSVGSDGQSHKTVSTNHNLFEEKGEPKRYRTEVIPLTSLTHYR